LLAGTAWPGRPIGKHLAQIMRDTDQAGHEVGLHAWDHHGWQAHAGDWSQARMENDIALGANALEDILARPVTCSATAGWRTTQAVIDAKQRFGFRYNSDCRGHSPFRPVLSTGDFGTPQIPVNLPTYDEVAGRKTTATTFNDFILARIQPNVSNVYTVHAEVEGGVMAPAFDALLDRFQALGLGVKPLGDLLPADPEQLPPGRVVAGEVAGREGWLGVQTPCE